MLGFCILSLCTLYYVMLNEGCVDFVGLLPLHPTVTNHCSSSFMGKCGITIGLRYSSRISTGVQCHAARELLSCQPALASRLRINS